MLLRPGALPCCQLYPEYVTRSSGSFRAHCPHLAPAHMLRMLQQVLGPRPLLPRLPACQAQAVRHQMSSALQGDAAVATESSRRLARGIVFDMDGTLTKAVIDFAEMRRRVAACAGLDSLQGDILDVIASWPAEQQQAAHAAIAEIEARALRDMQLMPGVLELSQFLDEQGVPRALVTRNVNASVEFFHRHHFTLPPFMPALSREFAPYKPHPASLLHIAEKWGVQPQELVMIGDSAKDDIVCGNRAGALTILLDEQSKWSSPEELQGEERPHYIARTLRDVQEVLQQHIDLQPPLRAPEPLT